MDENENNAQNQPVTLKSGFLVELYEYMEMLVIVFLVAILLFSVCFRICSVSGPSMEQTLYDKEALLVADLFYQPKQGDIIVFHQTSQKYEHFNEAIVKRVIATGGQWVDIDKHRQTVTIYDENFENPQVLDESAYRYLSDGSWDIPLVMAFPVKVPEGHLFVMGDNRNNSSDSSSSPAIGFVDSRRVLGHVVFRMLPFSRFGIVK